MSDKIINFAHAAVSDRPHSPTSSTQVVIFYKKRWSPLYHATRRRFSGQSLGGAPRSAQSTVSLRAIIDVYVTVKLQRLSSL